LKRQQAAEKESSHINPMPLDREFYSDITFGENMKRVKAPTRTVLQLSGFEGSSVEVAAGEVLTISLLEGPQIVNLFAFNSADPDERLWLNQSQCREGHFLTRYSRLWGTMARVRPLMTVLEETVVTREPFGHHHPVLGGSGTPADWRYAGGQPGIRTTWEQFAGLMEERDLSPALLKENVCLFQKARIDPFTQRVEILPSDALAGDRLTFFAEIDLCVLIALSPYIDGSVPAPELGEPEPRAIEVTVAERLATPLPWPYPGVAYPDLDHYLDATGVRSTEPGLTPGIPNHAVATAGGEGPAYEA
jgi:uncharacterized protein YcgI (DUF1989 family)